MKKLVKLGLVAAGLFSSGAQATKVEVHSCGNRLEFDNSEDVGSFTTYGLGTCMMGNGDIVDLCSGKRQINKLDRGTFRLMEDKGPSNTLQPGTYTIPKGKQPTFSKTCDEDLIIKEPVSFTIKTPTNGKHLQITGVGQLINSATGETILKMRKGQFVTRKKKPEQTSNTRMEL